MSESIHHATALVGTAAGASATTASLLGALPTVVSVVAGLLTIAFMGLQIVLTLRDWNKKDK